MSGAGVGAALRRAKAVAGRLLDVLATVIGRVQVEVLARRHAGRPLWVLDLDNTLADTWPSYLQPHPSERARIDGLVPLAGMIAATHDQARAEGAGVVVLSHRSLRHRALTLAWLRRHGVEVGGLHLVLVPSAASKVPLLRRLCRAGCDVTYWDDLTHGTERGEHAPYQEVLDAVRTLPLRHHGEDEIAAIVTKADPGRAQRVADLLAAAGVRVDDR